MLDVARRTDRTDALASSLRREARGLSNFVTLGVVLIALLLLAWVLSRRAVDSPSVDGEEVAVGPPLGIGPRGFPERDLAVGPRRGAVPSPANARRVTDDAGAEPRSRLHVRVTHNNRPVADALVGFLRVDTPRHVPVIHWVYDFDRKFVPTSPIAVDSARAWVLERLALVEPVATAADGSVSMDLVQGYYEIGVSLDTGPGRYVGLVEVSLRDRTAAEVDVQLELVTRVIGVVVDESGRPVSGALVHTRASSQEPSLRNSPPTTTGVDGRFELLGFGQVAHVVTVHDASRNSTANGLSATRPADALAIEATQVVVHAADLQRVVVPVRRTERTVLELHLPGVVGGEPPYAQPDMSGRPTEPGVWLAHSRGQTWMRGGDHLPGAPLYVDVPDGRGSPWYVLRLDGCEPIVAARQPGGVRRLVPSAGRDISGTIAAARAGERPPRIFAFVLRGEDRVQFNSVKGPSWTLPDAPRAAFDIAAHFLDGTRIGPWVRVPAGDRDVTDVEVALYPPR